MLNSLIAYQWEIFISLEVLSVIALLLFGIVRYFLDRKKVSRLFIGVFLGFLFLEAVLALIIYQSTGEISTFQIVIALFLIYACTFGVFDFLKLDRWMREKIGGWRGIELLTEKDYRIIERNKDPKYLAKKYRRSSLIHLTLFVIVQSIFWMYGTKDFEELIGYLKDLSWIEEGTPEESPYPNEAVYAVGMIWGIVFIVDFIWSWSYTLSPSKPKE
ncbi:hypothetical protein KQI49_02450 [Virgibacillus sp. MSJ-26]|uniref:hypothetical protein n=1 Tax=Virgibacillus sp. MSJ-26 TaxID=2841522 RepID=UPI001C11CAA3|nr:hypothetical protein [Virgibacillus sp. MSJ-26]